MTARAVTAGSDAHSGGGHPRPADRQSRQVLGARDGFVEACGLDGEVTAGAKRIVMEILNAQPCIAG